MNVPLTASELGINPFAPGEIGASPGPEKPAIDPRAPGLDGDIWDQLLKGRWQEGHETGYDDGFKRAADRYASIFDQGHETGRSNGVAATQAQMAGLLVPTLQRQLETFAKIKEKTTSPDIKDACDLGVEAALAVVEALSQLGLNASVHEGQAASPGQAPR